MRIDHRTAPMTDHEKAALLFQMAIDATQSNCSAFNMYAAAEAFASANDIDPKTARYLVTLAITQAGKQWRGYGCAHKD